METNERLIRAVEQATRTLASSGHIDSLLYDVLAICVKAVGASGGTIYIHDEGRKRLLFRHVIPEEVREKLPVKEIPDDFGVAGEVFQTRKIKITNFKSGQEARSDIEEATGVIVKSMITVPLTMEDEEPIGVVQLIDKISGKFTETDALVLDTIAAVSTMAIHNSRLTEEATRASTLLGMGKVSHDIGNLAASLFANIAFSELAIQGLRDQVEDRNAEDTAMYLESLSGMLSDLKSSVDRIVGYSRLVSDLSAGKTPRANKRMASLAETIQTSAAYLESEGRKNAVALRYELPTDAPPLFHDELFVFRIVQNLVGNAIKAVRETVPDDWQEQVERDDHAVLGEVTVRYKYKKGSHILEVLDTGPGMTREMADLILSGSARSYWAKGGGSGWGTRIVRELAAAHDAAVEIDSELGKGTTFRVVFPHVTVEVPEAETKETPTVA
jgi:signal transduction histidine kinase